MISTTGAVNASGNFSPPVPGYRDLMRNIDAKQVFVRPNGSIEFELWGPLNASSAGFRRRSRRDYFLSDRARIRLSKYAERVGSLTFRSNFPSAMA